MIIKEVHPMELSLTRDLAFGFFEESGLSGNLNFAYWVTCWNEFINKGLGSIHSIVNGVTMEGMIGGFCVPCSMTGDMEAIEAFWYVKQQHRGGVQGIRLLMAFQDWAKRMGAARIKMMHLATLNADKMEKMYIRLGYRPLEVAYVKDL